MKKSVEVYILEALLSLAISITANVGLPDGSGEPVRGRATRKLIRLVLGV